jgi:hypothetical protein
MNYVSCFHFSLVGAINTDGIKEVIDRDFQQRRNIGGAEYELLELLVKTGKS